MKTKLLYVLLALALAVCACNKKNGEQTDAPEVNAELNAAAEYPGNDEALLNDLNALVKYPEEALENGLSGKVYVEFHVDESGKVSNAKIVRGVGPILDKETLRVVSGLNKTWKPAEKEGVAAASRHVVNFDFKDDASIEVRLVEVEAENYFVIY